MQINSYILDLVLVRCKLFNHRLTLSGAISINPFGGAYCIFDAHILNTNTSSSSKACSKYFLPGSFFPYVPFVTCFESFSDLISQPLFLMYSCASLFAMDALVLFNQQLMNCALEFGSFD